MITWYGGSAAAALSGSAGACYVHPQSFGGLVRDPGEFSRSCDGGSGQFLRRIGRQALRFAGPREAFDHQEYIGRTAARNRGDGIDQGFVFHPDHLADRF